MYIPILLVSAIVDLVCHSQLTKHVSVVMADVLLQDVCVHVSYRAGRK